MGDARPTCFISYCREGVDEISVKHFVQHLKEISKNGIDFLFDDDLPGGARFDKFMELIRETDGVILLLTPEYKKRVEARKGGVYSEYSEILRRYDDLTNAANTLTLTNSVLINRILPPFCFLPLRFAGSLNDCCPDEIVAHKCIDFSTYRAHAGSDGKSFVNSQVARLYEDKIRRVIDEINAYHSGRSSSVYDDYDELKEKLLEQTKHDYLRGDPKFAKLFERVFVKTHAFKNVTKQSCYIMIGRKGSGKSTIIHYLSFAANNKYKGAIEINVDDFDLEFMYSFMTSAQMHADLDTVIRPVKLFEIVWRLFIVISCMYVLSDEELLGRLTNEQAKMMDPINSLLERINVKVDGSVKYVALYRWCYAIIIRQIEASIQAARNDQPEFSGDLALLLDPQYMINQALVRECYLAFNKIIEICERRFLISLDGFDTAFEEFRIQTQISAFDDKEMQRRAKYEIDWLRGFVHVVIEMKSSAGSRFKLARIVDFCVTLPKDRFFEIRNEERDNYIYIRKFHEIRWSAIELCILFYKRLEALFHIKTDRSLAPRFRLDEILKKKLSSIPLNIVVSRGKNDHIIPIFVYVSAAHILAAS